MKFHTQTKVYLMAKRETVITVTGCAECKTKTAHLFRAGDKMVCCQCKYGTSLWQRPVYLPSLCSSRQQPVDLQWYNKHSGGRRW